MTEIDLWIESRKIWYCLDFWTDGDECLALRVELMENVQ